MNKKDTTALETLTSQLSKAKSKLLKFQAKERDIRNSIDQLLAKNGEQSIKIESLTTSTTFTRATNLAIPKAAYVDIIDRLPKDVFDNTFTTSYRIKAAVYNELTGKNKEIIDTHLQVKNAPSKVVVKEVE